jgi:transposase InsO family protein
VAHRNARLTVHGRRLIVARVLEEGWSPSTAAEAAGVSRATVYKWLARFREHGEEGLQDRTSRPRRCPNRLNDQLERRILLARKRRRWGPHQLEFYLGVPRSTAYKVLVRHGCSRLADFDRPTGTKIRYVRDRPGELLHVDVKKLGRIPDGGGWRVHGRDGVLDRSHRGGLGYDKLHIAVDDHSRLAFVQVHPDEKGPTCAAFLADAVAWFASKGITIERVMTDNAKNYTVSRDFQQVLRTHRIKHKRIRAYRPQTNGKVERFNRTLVDEFAYARTFAGNQARLDALPRWLRYYNNRRRHTALDGHTPHEIVNNLCGKNT